MTDADGGERRHVADIPYADFYADTLGEDARTFYDSLPAWGSEAVRTAKVMLHQTARMVWLADRIQEVSKGRPAVPITFYIIAAEAVAKLAAGFAKEGQSRRFVREFFAKRCTEAQRARMHRALEWATPSPPRSPDGLWEYLYRVRCDVVHEGRYFDMTVEDEVCIAEVRTVVLEAALNTARAISSNE